MRIPSFAVVVLVVRLLVGCGDSDAGGAPPDAASDSVPDSTSDSASDFDSAACDDPTGHDFDGDGVPNACDDATVVPRFGIYEARVDGTRMRLVLGDDARELTHPRLSRDDAGLLTVSRYHAESRDGLAEQHDGYAETEVLVMHRDDPASLRSVDGPHPGVATVNSSFDDLGRLLYLAQDPGDPERIRLRRVAVARDLTLGEFAYVPTAPGVYAPTDPHSRGGHVAYTAFFTETDPDDGSVVVGRGVFRMPIDGDPGGATTERLSSDPQRATDPAELLGDADPRISPDGSRVAFMRHNAAHTWHLLVVDVATRAVRDLSEGLHPVRQAEGVPDWSPAGSRLVLFQFDLRVASRATASLHTIAPDGTDRVVVPLPEGFCYHQPNYDPRAPDADPVILFAARVADDLGDGTFSCTAHIVNDDG